MIKFADIHFLGAGSLAEKLHRNEISEEVAFSQFLLGAMVFGANVGVSPELLLDQLSTPTKAATFFIQLLLQYWGLTLLYKTNKHGDGKDFFLRLGALALPVAVQMLLVGAIVGACVGYLGGALANFDFGDEQRKQLALQAVGTIGGGLIGVIYFFLMRSYFKIAAGVTDDRHP